MQHNGYLPAVGSAAARAAIAQTESSPSFPVTKDVRVGVGLELSVCIAANPP